MSHDLTIISQVHTEASSHFLPVSGMAALLISQLTIGRRAAAGCASILLILFVLLDMIGRELNGFWVQYLSPVYYYSLNRPLLIGFPNQPQALLIPLGLAVLCLVGSLIQFALLRFD